MYCRFRSPVVSTGSRTACPAALVLHGNPVGFNRYLPRLRSREGLSIRPFENKTVLDTIVVNRYRNDNDFEGRIDP
jgi:hypothetical protein